MTLCRIICTMYNSSFIPAFFSPSINFSKMCCLVQNKIFHKKSLKTRCCHSKRKSWNIDLKNLLSITKVLYLFIYQFNNASNSNQFFKAFKWAMSHHTLVRQHDWSRSPFCLRRPLVPRHTVRASESTESTSVSVSRVQIAAHTKSSSSSSVWRRDKK